MAGRGVRRLPRGPRPSAAKERFWRGHVARQAAGGLSVRAYCARHALAEPSFYGWRRELARRDAAARRQEPGAARQRSSRGLGFVQLNVPADSARPPQEPTIEIVLERGTVVRVPRGADGATLSAVLVALNAARGPSC